MNPRRLSAFFGAGLLGLACLVPTAGAQAPADVTALTQEVQGLRKSVDGLLALFKQYATEQDRNSRATLLLRRIEVGEQMVASLTSELRALRSQVDAGEKNVLMSRGRAASARSMSNFNPDPSSAEVLAQEQTRAAADEQVAQAGVDRLQPRIAELEAEIATRKAAIRALEAQLDKELSPPAPR